MASRRAEPARRDEGAEQSFTTSALLGILSQSVDGAPSVAVATAAPSNDTPKSIDRGRLPPVYKTYTPLGAAVTSIQVLRMLFARVLTPGLTPDSLSLALALSLSLSLFRFLSRAFCLSLSLALYLNHKPHPPNPQP